MTASQELLTWLNGSPTGGPHGDGRYPLTYADGMTYLIYCPAAQALNPAYSEQAVEVFTGQALAAADTAVEYAGRAKEARDVAVATETVVIQAADQVASDKAQVLDFANIAETAKDNAEYAATQAQTHRDTATSAAAMAQKWAAEAPNTVVEGGLYSARHYADVANTIVANMPEVDNMAKFLNPNGQDILKTEAGARLFSGPSGGTLQVDTSSSASSGLAVRINGALKYNFDSSGLISELPIKAPNGLTLWGNQSSLGTAETAIEMGAGKWFSYGGGRFYLGGGGLAIPNGNITMGSLLGQKLNLWSTAYGIGIQNNTMYFRAGEPSFDGFAWYLGGVHSNTKQDPGTGGIKKASLTDAGLTVYGNGNPNAATAAITTTGAWGGGLLMLDANGVGSITTGANALILGVGANTPVSKVYIKNEPYKEMTVYGTVSTSGGSSGVVINSRDTGYEWHLYGLSGWFHLWNTTSGNVFSVDQVGRVRASQFIADRRGSGILPQDFHGHSASWGFHNLYETGFSGGTTYHALHTILPWADYQNEHRQQQVVYHGWGMAYRYALGNQTWGPWMKVLQSNQAQQIHVTTSDPVSLGLPVHENDVWIVG